MRGHSVIVVITWVLGLLNGVVGQAAGAGNIWAHAYERIWLWEMYDLFVNKYEPAKQSMIFPQSNTGHIGLRNKGSGPNGRLTYSEFMFRLQGGAVVQGRPPNVGQHDLEAFSPSRAGYDGAAQRLKSVGYVTPVERPDQVDPTLKVYKPDPEDPHKGAYTALVEKIDREFEIIFHGDEDFAIISRAKEQQLLGLAEKIIRIREEDTQRFLGEKFKEAPKDANDKLRMGLTKTVFDTVPSAAGGGTYQKVNVAATFQAYTKPDGTLEGDLAKHFPHQGAMIDWMTENGNPYSGDWTEGSKRHWRLLKSWNMHTVTLELTRNPKEGAQTCRI
ncbi:hypothetical protein M011DRAFT_455933 [Sporormia fimetaria CBS 119925]|uniref:Uncharacterized protein n=1 Tax=Sporormia fimetaria CBS 119925 TaxID=1340428 RepID=A0A6A6VK21_9PLEO|nr:hypothetical protein M011DRAFT_455933 [Sporormia fimetaria CBS 119925]